MHKSNAFILGTRRIAPPDLLYERLTLNGQRAIIARLADGRPFFALFLYLQDGRVQQMHVIAGHKLAHLAG